MAISRWEPFRELATIREMMDRMFEEMFRPTRVAVTRMVGLPMDICELDDRYELFVPLPGVRPEDVDISVQDTSVTIRCRFTAPSAREEFKNCRWISREIPTWEFSRTETLPYGLQADQAEAIFENGMLRLRIPKSVEARPRKIPIKTTTAVAGSTR